MRCPGCGARVGERDRACFACHQELMLPVSGDQQDSAHPRRPVPPDHREPVPAEPRARAASALAGISREGSAAAPGSEAGSELTTKAVTPTAPPRPAPPEPLQIEIAWGRERRTATVPPEGATIGSSKDADIRVGAAFLAPVHVRMILAPEGWVAETLVTEARVLCSGVAADRAVVARGDVLRVADRIGNFVTVRIIEISRPSLREGALRSLLPEPGGSFLMGSDYTCGVVLDHPLVQRRHAALRRDDAGSLWLEDRGTSAGTYVNGSRLRGRQRLSVGDVLQIGPFSATVGRSALEPLTQVAGVDIRAVSASVTVAGGSAPRHLLRDVSLWLEPASLTAIVGPSGAGKTTLMRVLSGQLAPTSGGVTYNGTDLSGCRQTYAELTGFVPQDDVVHLGLTITEALGYQAQLRLGSTTGESERRARVDQLLQMLLLTEQRDQLVGTLSGGQRKRVSIAVELLKEPQLLFLDEPTSGLDPGLDKRMMLLLRLLADQGRTVVLTTHAIAHVDVCDNLLLVGPGGRVIYAGPPEGAPAAFGVSSLGDVFSLVDAPEAVARAALAVTATPAAPGTPFPAPKAPTPVPRSRGPALGSPAWRHELFSHGRIFAARQVRLLARDRSSSAFTLLQGVIVGLLTVLVAPRPFIWAQNGSSVVFVLGCSGVWFGMISAVRELVKERPIWRREFSSGASLEAYFAAKITILAGIALVQSLSLALVVEITLGSPPTSPLGDPFLGMLLTLWLANLCGVTVGLLVSAGSRNADRAVSLVPYLLIGQLVLAGVLFQLGALTFVSWIVPARWVVSALGSVAGLSSGALHQSSGLYPGSAGGLVGTWLMLVVLTATAGLAVLWSLKREAVSWTAGLDAPSPLLRTVVPGLIRSAARARSQDDRLV